MRAACEAYAQGIDLDRLLLELEHAGHADHHVNSPGFWLTSADRSYRRQWLKTARLAACPGNTALLWFEGGLRQCRMGSAFCLQAKVRSLAHNLFRVARCDHVEFAPRWHTLQLPNS